jgi:hypothetical protein
MPRSESARTAGGNAQCRGRTRWAGLLLGAALALVPAAALRAETAAPPPASSPAATPATTEAAEQVWTAAALDKLVGRIALYPDALIAQILPAATLPLQVVEAARWLEAQKSVAEGDKQEWDPSVKALLRYPRVLRMMSGDLRWTDELGQAFIAQPEDVLKAVQRLRRVARALGNLKPTPRQRVIVDPDSTIIIAPPEAEPDIVYIPVYDPEVVFFEPPPPSGVWVTFDVGFPLGIWIGTGVSWTSWHVVHGGWSHDWGWGSVYGGCCRGAVYTYTPTVINRRLTIDNRHLWRPRPVSERRRPPQFRSTPSFRAPTTPRPTPGDISRGRLPPRTATAPTPTDRRDPRSLTRTPGFSNLQRAPITERNAQRGRESLRRFTAPSQPRMATPGTATPPARFTTPPTSRMPERRDRVATPRAPQPGTPSYRFAPRTHAPSPGFMPRTQPDTQRFHTRGSESRMTMPRAPAPRIQTPSPAPRIHTPSPAPRVHTPSPPQRTSPPVRGEPPKTSAPSPLLGPSRSPQSGDQRRHR